jgi:single-stranded DNA-specific DHH superfamily exonuclease
LQEALKSWEVNMEYLMGKKEYFLDFLNNLTKEDKIGIISHNDLDGIASALIIDEVLKSKNIKFKGLEFTNYGKGMFTEIKKKFIKKKINKLLIFDISLDSDYEGFKELEKNFNVFVVDHHPSEISPQDNILKTNSLDCATFTLFDLCKNDFDLSKWEWLVCATMITEFSFKKEENFEFIKQHYPTTTLEDISNSEPAKMAKGVAPAIDFFSKKEKKVFNLLKKGKIKRLEKYEEIISKEIKLNVEKFLKEAQFYKEKNLYFYYSHLNLGISSAITTQLAIKEPDKTFVFVSDINDKPGFVKVSARNSNSKDDMNALMKKGVAGLEQATGGGHIPAAGASFLKKDLEKFKENLLS